MEILCGARVMTMHAYQPEAAAVAIDGALIVAVGSESHVRAVAGAAPVTRLPGGVLLPGFIDAHHHYAYAALAGQTAPLRTPRGSSIKELLRRIAAEAGASPAGCVYLCGYEPWELCEQRGPRAEELDDACPDRPLFVQAANAHEGVLNTRGLQLMGWDARTPDPPNGTIVRRRGKLTGQLVEAAAFMAEARFRDEALATGERAWLAACERHGRELLSLGITRVADAAAARPVEALYQKAAEAGVLPLAVHPMPVASSDLLRPRLSGLPTGTGPADASVGAAKLFVDGGHRCALCLAPREAGRMLAATVRHAWSSRTLAAVRHVKRAGPIRVSRDLHVHAGMRVWERDALADIVGVAAGRGFQVAQHAIGDDAIGMALHAVAKSEAALHRRPGVPRLEHVVMARPEHLRAAGDLGVAAVVQPGFVHHYGDDLLATPLPEPIGMLPLRDMVDAGVVLAGSSDYPATPPNVMAAIQAGVTRKTARGALLEADQAIDTATLLRAYTAGSSVALGLDDRVGRVKVGMQADLVHLAADPTTAAPDTIGAIAATRTWVGGRLAYSR